MLVLLFVLIMFAAAFTLSFVSDWRTITLRPAGMARRFRIAVRPQRRARELVTATASKVSRASLVGVDGEVLVPNQVSVELHPQDWDFAAPIRTWIESNIRLEVEALTTRPKWKLAGPVEVLVSKGAGGLSEPLVHARFAKDATDSFEPEPELLRTVRASEEFRTTAKLTTWIVTDESGCVIAEFVGDHKVGRSDRCGTVLNDCRVSSQHALFKPKDGVLWIQDLESTNGTFVNEQKVAVARVSIDDVIRIGSTILQITTSDNLATRRDRVER